MAADPANVGELQRKGDFIYGKDGLRVFLLRPPKNYWSPTDTDPTVNDDETQGFEKHSRWLNDVKETIWTCFDATEGAAVWKKSPTGGSASSGRASFVVTLTSQAGPYREVGSATYETLGRFVYDGITVLGLATAMIAAVHVSSGQNGAVDVRIYDGTNAALIVEETGITNEDPFVVTDLGDIDNLPDSRAVFEIQVRKSGGSGNVKGAVSSVVLEF